MQVLGQQDQVVTVVALVAAVVAGFIGDIDLTAQDGLELGLALAPLLVELGYIVVQLLDAEHVAVVGQRHAAHAVGNGLVNERLDGCLPVQDRVL